MRIFVTVALLATLACASKPLPVSQEPIDWPEADEHWSLLIVTEDPDGDERVTRIWLALVNGEGTLRTGDSRWWENLERDPNCRIRVAGTDHPLRVDPVSTHKEKANIDDAFGEKYGWLERTMFRQERGETHENYAHLRPQR